jgi:UDP-glucose 4,6-dehydratase
MILLLGASGYIGQAFARELTRRQWPFRPCSRAEMDYSRFETLVEFVQASRPSFVLNAAGLTGRPNVDACETMRAETLTGNVLLPLTIAHACAATGTPWGHVSSGCIYSGAHIDDGGIPRVEKDLAGPDVRGLIDRNPRAVRGFRETDEPNFSFRQPPCSFYSGTKALAEEALEQYAQGFLWRPRLPFDHADSTKNYLTKIQRYERVYDNVNSLSHRGDFVRACLDLWERRAPFGIYNVTNPGFVTTRQVAGLIQKVLKPARAFQFFADDEEFYRVAAKTPRSNCVLDTSKLLAAGVTMRPVEEAVLDSLKNWEPAS